MLPIRLSSYLHSELSQPHSGERDVTKPGGREVENKAEPKPSCHSLTGVLTIIGCHHFLIRPVSKKCSNKTAVQRNVPPPYCTHTHIPSRVIDVHTHHTDTCKHIKHVRKCYVQNLRIKRVWLHGEMAALPAAGISQINPETGGVQRLCKLTAHGIQVFVVQLEE